MRYKLIKNLIFFITIFIVINGYAETLDTTLSQNKISLGDAFTITFTAKNGSSNTPDFSPLQTDFYILSKQYGTSINIVNGVTSAQTVWQLTLQPKKVGELLIPEITFGNDKSASQKLMVVNNAGASSTATTDEKRNSQIFVTAEVDQSQPYVQSQVLYTVKLFYQSQPENVRMDVPQVNDGIMVQVGDGKNYQTTLKGENYLVAEKTFAFFPHKAGEITIPPAHLQALSYDNDSSSYSYPYYYSVPKRLSLTTQAVKLNVQKPPVQFQGATWLPAKSVTLTEDWSKTAGQWEEGNPVTRTITLKAEGLRADQIPDLQFEKIADINTYIDPPKRSNNIEGDGVVGTLEQKITYIPNAAHDFTLPGMKIYWWNTQTNSNVTSQLSPITISVKGKIKESHPVATQTTIPGAIRTIPTSPNKNEKSSWSIWFWVTLVFVFLWMTTLWFFLRKNTHKDSVKAKSTIENKLNELNDENFALACVQGKADMAQQFLLSWAKNQSPDVPLNLEKIAELADDEHFKVALKNLQEALYAKKTKNWDGNALLAAYKQLKKREKKRFLRFKLRRTKITKSDPLPPLNPS